MSERDREMHQLRQFIEKKKVESTPLEIINLRLAKKNKKENPHSTSLRFANEEDYTRQQGGVPAVYELPRQTFIHHNYPGATAAGALVSSSKTIEEYGTIRLPAPGPGGYKDFAVALLWEMHGQPCENQSQKGKGGRYPRVSR